MSVLEKIREEITQNMERLDREAKQTQDDVDCGICIGYQLALNIIDKYDCHGCPICSKVEEENIRAEIENQKQVHENESNVDYGVRSGLSIALKIIDKYTSEKCEHDCEHCAYIECPKDDSDTISYNDDFATALEKISKYEDRKTERMENALNHIRTAVDVDEWAVKEVERVFENYDEMRMMLAETEYAKEHETCEGCTHPCIMYEPKMKACERKHECEDAVSRQDALRICYEEDMDDTAKRIHSKLTCLPSVQPKARVGHWQKRSEIVHKSYGFTTTRLEGTCSECGERQAEEVYGNACDFDLGKFCKNCGARMVDE